MDGSMLGHLGQAIILGLVQGVTEFLPFSSTGHLIIVRDFLGLPDLGNVFDAVLHLGTLLAILVYFRKDWRRMLFPIPSKKETKMTLTPNRRLLGMILIATIPGLLVGYLGNYWVENHWRSLLAVAILMVAMGVTYLLFEQFIRLPKASKSLTIWDALSIGIAQASAVISAIPRSGVTLLAGMYVGLARDEAAKFSFLLAAPVMAAAGGYSLYVALAEKSLTQDYWFWLMAFVISTISGLLAIGWLLKFYQKYSLKGFAYYLLVMGAGLVIYHFLR